MNKRCLTLELTPKGKKTLNEVFGQVEGEMQLGLDKLSSKERKDLESGLIVLNKLMNSFDEV